jgi:hypothetical protein
MTCWFLKYSVTETIGTQRTCDKVAEYVKKWIFFVVMEIGTFTIRGMYEECRNDVTCHFTSLAHFDRKDSGRKFHRNVGTYLPIYTTSRPRRSWEPQSSHMTYITFKNTYFMTSAPYVAHCHWKFRTCSKPRCQERFGFMCMNGTEMSNMKNFCRKTSKEETT